MQFLAVQENEPEENGRKCERENAKNDGLNNQRNNKRNTGVDVSHLVPSPPQLK
jgi:hypothetical protein